MQPVPLSLHVLLISASEHQRCDKLLSFSAIREQAAVVVKELWLHWHGMAGSGAGS